METMLYNATTDTSTVSEKRTLRDVKRHQNGAEFCIPPGYMTGDEFVRRVTEELEQKLRDNGYLE